MPAEFIHLYIRFLHTYNNKKIYVIFVITVREDTFNQVKTFHDYIYYLI